jgi:archaellin
MLAVFAGEGLVFIAVVLVAAATAFYLLLRTT